MAGNQVIRHRVLQMPEPFLMFVPAGAVPVRIKFQALSEPDPVDGFEEWAVFLEEEIDVDSVIITERSGLCARTGFLFQPGKYEVVLDVPLSDEEIRDVARDISPDHQFIF